MAIKKLCLNAQRIGKIRLSVTLRSNTEPKTRQEVSVTLKKAHKMVTVKKKPLEGKKPCPGGTCE